MPQECDENRELTRVSVGRDGSNRWVYLDEYNSTTVSMWRARCAILQYEPYTVGQKAHAANLGALTIILTLFCVVVSGHMPKKERGRLQKKLRYNKMTESVSRLSTTLTSAPLSHVRSSESCVLYLENTVLLL